MIHQLKFGTIKWYHIPTPTEDDYNFLLNEMHFHPLDIEDCKSTSVVQRSKIDEYDDYYFIILHFPYFDKLNKFLRVREIKIFWTEDAVLTVGKPHWTTKLLFNDAKEVLESSSEQDHPDFSIASSDQLLYNILNPIIDETYKLVRRIGVGIDYISSDLFDQKAQKSIESISVTRKNIILLNTIFKPQLRVFRQFATGGVDGFSDSMEDYWGDLLDAIQKIWDMTEDYEELIESLSKTFDSMQANKTNEIMKILTFFSTIVLPLTFITGLYGMNVRLPFAEQEDAFFGIIFIMILMAILMFIYFKKRNWL